MTNLQSATDSRKDQTSVMCCLYYGLPVGAISMLHGGPLVVLQSIYAEFFGLSLAVIATVVLVARLFDTVSDPIIGYWSDRYYAKKGNRKPFILFGSLVFIVGAYFLFNPVKNVNGIYFLFFILLFYLGYTLFSIPHYAWGNDISGDSKSSTKIYAVRASFMYFGILLFYALPQVPYFESTEFTPQVLRWAVFLAAVLLIPSLYFNLKNVPGSLGRSFFDGDICKGHSPQDKKDSDVGLFVLWLNVKHNEPFLIFLSAFILWGVGIGCWGGLLFIFINSYMDMGEHFSLAALISVGGSLMSVKLFSRLAMNRGKIFAWVISSLMTTVSIFLMLLLDPKDPNLFLLVVIMLMAYLGSISFMIFAPALLSDIVDYGTWKFGGNFAGSYFSLFMMVAKANDAIGVALGLTIVNSFGFSLSSPNNEFNSVWGLKLAAIWIPAVLFLLSVFIIRKIPITTHRHAIICRALARREQRWGPSCTDNYQSVKPLR